MNDANVKYFDLLAARKAYAEGRNVTQVLREQKGLNANTPQIIEIAYDLQAGTYIEHARNNRTKQLAYVAEMAEVIDRHVEEGYSLLDIGTGEITTLSLLTAHLALKPRHVFAFDISWSRVYKGLGYAREVMGDGYDALVPFVADISEIPLQDKSISVTISSHALEPNGGALTALLSELFRVTAHTLILFEPCYELNSDEGKQRMDRLGYIKHMAQTVEALGGTLLEQIAIKNVSNPLNPTVGFVIIPPGGRTTDRNYERATDRFSVPGTDLALQKQDAAYHSEGTGLCFFELKSIPVLTSRSAVLASALLD
jgi:SAM-dependent methyltransferase